MKKTKKVTKKNSAQNVRKEYIGLLVIVLIMLVGVITYKWMHATNPLPQMSQYTTGAQTGSTIPIDSSLAFKQGNSSVDVVVNTGVDQISGVQLAITYDPKALTNVKVTSGNFFNDPIELENVVDTTAGTIDYTLAIKPNGQSVKGQGTVATISYDKVPNSGGTRLMFKPLTKVTALGANISVLKTYQSITLP